MLVLLLLLGVEMIGTSGTSGVASSWPSSDDKDGRITLGLATFFPFPCPPFPFAGIVEVETCSFYKSLKREANIINISLKISIIDIWNTGSSSEICSSSRCVAAEDEWEMWQIGKTFDLIYSNIPTKYYSGVKMFSA